MRRLNLLFGVLPVLVVSLFSPLSAFAKGDSQFPHREKFPQCVPITTERFLEIFDQAIVIDTRNSVEFGVIQVLGAKNLPSGKMKKPDLLKLRGLTDATPIVFYCNGFTCSKSYKGSAKAIAWGFKNVFTYDSGVFNWAKASPTLTKFFGETMTTESLEEKLISKENFLSVCKSPGDFIEAAKSGRYTIFDIRDNAERSETPIRLPGIKKLSMDQFVKFLGKKNAIPQSNILVLDNAGKQVKWLQYHLREQGRTDYFFLSKGVRQWGEQGFDANGNPGASARSR